MAGGARDAVRRIRERQQRRAREAGRAGKLHRRQERGARGGDVGVRPGELCFSTGEVRAAHQQVGRQARSDFGNRERSERFAVDAEVLRDAAEQHRERGERLALLIFERQQRGALREHGAALAADVKRGGRTVAIAGLDDVEHALGDREVVAGDVEAGAGCEQLEIRVRDAGDERQPHRLEVVAGRRKARAGASDARSEPAPQVDFVADREARARRFAVDGTSSRGVGAPPVGVAPHSRERQQRRASGAQLDLGLAHAFRRDAEIGAAGERLVDQAFELARRKTAPPASARLHRDGGHGLGPARRHRQPGLRRRFGDRAAGDEQRNGCEEQSAPLAQAGLGRAAARRGKGG